MAQEYSQQVGDYLDYVAQQTYSPTDIINQSTSSDDASVYLQQPFDEKSSQISQAIRGAEAILEQTDDPAQKEAILQDLVLMSTAANEYKRDWQQQQDVAIEQERQAQAKALEGLASGSYVETYQPPVAPMPFGPPGGLPPITDIAKTRQNFQEQAAKGFGLDPEDIDPASGVTALDRFAMAATPTDVESQLLMTQSYGPVLPYIDQGKRDYLVRSGDKWVKADEIGISAGDITAAVTSGAKEILPTYGSVRSSLASGFGLIRTPLMSATGYSGIHSIQDALTRKAFGLKIKPTEIAARRLPEFATVAFMDAALLGSSKFLSSRLFGRPKGSELAKQLQDSLSRLEKETGMKLSVPQGAKLGGEEGMRAQQVLAQMYPGAPVGRSLDKNIEQIQELITAMRGAGDPLRVSEKTVRAIKDDIDSLAALANQMEEKAGNAIRHNFSRRLADVQTSRQSWDKLGKSVSEVLEQAKATEKQIVDAAYQAPISRADEIGYSATHDEVLKMLASAKKQANISRTSVDDPIATIAGTISEMKSARREATRIRNKIARGQLRETQAIRDQLGELYAKGANLSFRDLINIKKDIEKGFSQTPSVGKSSDKQAVDRIAAEFDILLSQKAKQLGIGDMMDAANAEYKQNLLAFQRSSPGYAMRERFGDIVPTNTNIITRALRDPKDARDLVRAMDMAQDANGQPIGQQFRGSLQDAYLEKLGLGHRVGVTRRSYVDYSRDMLDALYGDKAGAQMAKKLDDLNTAFSAKSIDITRLGKDDIQLLRQALGDKQTKTVIKNLETKAIAERELERRSNSTIIQLAQKENWEVNNGQLSAAILSVDASPRAVQRIWQKMPQGERDTLAQDFAAEILNAYTQRGGVQTRTAPFLRMPNAEEFLRDIGDLPGAKPTSEGSKMLQKMNTILGERQKRTLIDLMRAIRASQVPAQKLGAEEVRATAGMAGMSIYLASGLGSFAHNRLMAAALGRGSLSPFVDVLARDTGIAATERAYKKMVATTLSTRSGIMNISQQMSRDPHFAEAMTQLMIDIRASEDAE